MKHHRLPIHHISDARRKYGGTVVAGDRGDAVVQSNAATARRDCQRLSARFMIQQPES
jgi:hypothetical protein